MSEFACSGTDLASVKMIEFHAASLLGQLAFPGQFWGPGKFPVPLSRVFFFVKLAVCDVAPPSGLACAIIAKTEPQ